MANLTPLLLNNVYSTVQAGSSAIGSATATGVNVATGDGAKFGTIGTNQYIPAAVINTSTTPETVEEYVWITAIATDALTVKRQAEESSRFPASTTSIQAGYIIAAVVTRDTLIASRADPVSSLAFGSALESVGGKLPVTSFSGIASGTLVLTPIWLPSGYPVAKIGFCTASPGASSPTHWWFGLYDSAFAQLAVTADQLTTALAAFTTVTLAIATTASGSASSYTTTYTGLHYIGLMVAASSAPSWASVASLITFAAGGSSPYSGAKTDTSQTSPPAFPHTAGTRVFGWNLTYGFVTP